ncbi:hypothetical protein HJC23_011600 [Cyclotella cryptica]|uniref:ER membrane protein complex subunit 10 n=1 Tax=Cyclotella cryptica TaxID=29204 RepID=A0ABD3QRC5_9STRA|eukprot:CCRYP_002726-RA/>CCRYP_002726-RA protein AED:0.01 eAED:-0.00 QI:0/-1/0/1/-1/1/1/0/308
MNLRSLGVLLWALTMGFARASDVGKSYYLYQTLGNETKPTPRGTITIAPSDGDSNSGSLVATYHPTDSAQLDLAAFDRMVDSGALYTLIVTEQKADNVPITKIHKVSASVPGCSVRRSNLREEITLSIGPTGKLMSVSYRPLISPLAAKTCDNLTPLSEKPEVIFGRNKEDGEEINLMPFKTSVSFESHKPMMEIPTVLPQSRPPPGLNWYRRNAKNNPSPLLGSDGGPPPFGDEEQPTGIQSTFLYRMITRYWYIALPLFIMGLFGGVEEPPSDQTGGGGGAGVATAAGGAVAAESARQTQRRGKRD